MKSLISFFRRKILRIPAARWDFQYQQGAWDSLAAESIRLDAVMDLIREKHPAASILEIGCGKAVMLLRMADTDFSSYTGMDFSRVAIESVKSQETDKIHFVHADMHHYAPREKFDVIVFNESLYYAKNPVAVMARYIPYLNRDGCIIVSAFANRYTARFWPALDKKWKSFREEKVGMGTQQWSIRLYDFPAGHA